MATPCTPPSTQLNTTLLIHESVRFFPARRAGRGHVQPSEDDPVSAAVAVLGDAIFRSQQPTSPLDCEVRGVRLALAEGEVPGEFEKTLSSMVKPMLHSLLHDHVPLGAQPGSTRGGRAYHFKYLDAPSRPLSVYQNQSRCESRSLECFLEPLSTCPEEQRLRLPARMLGDRFPDVAKYEKIYRSAPAAALPLVRQVQVAGQFNTVALLMSGMLRPSAAVAASVIQAKRDLGWPETLGQRRRAPLLIGLHHSCTGRAPRQACEPLQTYLPSIRELEREYGADRQVYIFLATDDAAAAAEARRLRDEALTAPIRAFSHAIWMARPAVQQQLPAGPAGAGALPGGADGYEDAVHSMVDVVLLSQCDALVGNFSSEVGRIAYALMAARRGEEMSRRTAERAASHTASDSPADERETFGTSNPAPTESPVRPPGLAEPGQGGLAGALKSGGGPRLCLPPFISVERPWCARSATPETPPAYEGALTRPAMREYSHSHNEGGVWCQ
jgi:hypothetical protein